MLASCRRWYFYSLLAKASLDDEFLEKLKELLGGDDQFKKVLSEVSADCDKSLLE